MTPAEWAAWLQAGAVTVAVAVAVWQIIEVRRTRRDEARAYLVVQLDVHQDRLFIPDVTLTNLGRTAAYDVTVQFDPPIRSTLYRDDDAERAPFFQDGLPTVAPGQRFTTLFDTMLERPKEWEDRYAVTVRYADRFGKPHEDAFVLDIGPHRGMQSVVRHSVHDVHSELKKLVTEIKHLRNGFGGPMPVQMRSSRSLRRENWARRRFRSWGRTGIPSTVLWPVYVYEWVRDEAKALRAAAHRYRNNG